MRPEGYIVLSFTMIPAEWVALKLCQSMFQKFSSTKCTIKNCRRRYRSCQSDNNFCQIWSHCCTPILVEKPYNDNETFHKIVTAKFDPSVQQSRISFYFILKTVWPDLFRHLGNFFINLRQIVQGLLSVWQNIDPTLAKMLCFWATFSCCKWPNIEK